MNLTEKITLLHGLRMSPQAKAMLVLVLFGHRPAVEIDLYSRDTSIGDTRQTLSALNLFCCTYKRQAQGSSYCLTMCIAGDFLVAKEVHDMAVLADQNPKRATAEFHSRFGQLMGYPQTAINAFVDRLKKSKKLMLPTRNYPDTMLHNPFRDFSFSAAHVKKETGLVLYWQALVKGLAPAIYAELSGVSVAA